MGVAGEAVPISATKLPVAGFRRQLAGCFTTVLMFRQNMAANCTGNVRLRHFLPGLFFVLSAQSGAVHNIVESFALDGQSENAPHHGGSFLVDQPMVFVLRVFLVTVKWHSWWWACRILP